MSSSQEAFKINYGRQHNREAALFFYCKASMLLLSANLMLLFHLSVIELNILKGFWGFGVLGF